MHAATLISLQKMFNLGWFA